MKILSATFLFGIFILLASPGINANPSFSEVCERHAGLYQPNADVYTISGENPEVEICRIKMLEVHNRGMGSYINLWDNFSSYRHNTINLEIVNNLSNVCSGVFYLSSTGSAEARGNLISLMQEININAQFDLVFICHREDTP